MRPLIRSLWQRFNRRRRAAATCVLHLDAHMLSMLAELAEEEGRPPGEVAADLLSFALVQRQTAGEYLGLWKGLSPREQEVAALASRGYTNRQIAERLVVSPETVKSHMYSILRKFALTKKNDLYRVLSLWDFPISEEEGE
jgi:DNA-binding CsgD family transcriptional regulator